MLYKIQHFRSSSTGKMFYSLQSYPQADMEDDWRASVTSSETGEPIFAIMYPHDLREPDFAMQVNKRLGRADLKQIQAIAWGADSNGYRIPTRYTDVFDENGYAELLKETSVTEYREAGGKLTVEGSPL